MSNLPSVDPNRLKGNYAQAITAEWLGRSCLVRPVAEGTDIGIDLYCESVVQQSPYLHFWAQVKAIPASSVTAQGDKTVASFRFETRHLRYWDRQPIPIYVFLVPIASWPPSTPPDRVFGVRITEYTVRNAIPSSATVLLPTSECFEAATLDRDLHQFLTEIVPWDTSALLLKKGIVAPIPEPHTTSQVRFPVGIGFQHLDKVLDTVRDASVHGLYHAMLVERHEPGAKSTRKRFEAVARIFEDSMHEYGLSMLVRAAHQDGDVSKAKAYVEAAISRIQSDHCLSDEDKRARIDKISVLLKDFE